MAEPISISYSFVLESGKTIRFALQLDRGSLALQAEAIESVPAWAALSFHRCANCPLDEAQHQACPVAANLVGIVTQFADLVSYDQAKVVVETEERTCLKETTVQQGLSSILGIVMVTSGCPVLEYLKPMVRFHLPFASVQETIFRMTSMYLVAQYLLAQQGKAHSLELAPLAQVYAEVGKVNREFSQRLLHAAKRDANVNALVELDSFASMVQLIAEDAIQELAPDFSAFLA